MKKKRKTSRSRKITYLLLAAAVVLLLGSAVGSTRAALTYYSENYTAQIHVGQIGVSLLENGDIVTRRDYDGDKWVETKGPLLEKMLKKDKGEKLVLNKNYAEELTVKNSGEIDEYVRVRIYKYWTKGEGDNKKKVTSLSPDLIKLNLINKEQWVNPDDKLDESAKKDKECTELYYKGILPKGEMAAFADTISIDKQIAEDVTITTKDNIITTTYKYDGVEFHLDVEVDAVQTHNAQDAIMSAWGVDAAALGIL